MRGTSSGTHPGQVTTKAYRLPAESAMGSKTKAVSPCSSVPTALARATVGPRLSPSAPSSCRVSSARPGGRSRYTATPCSRPSWAVITPPTPGPTLIRLTPAMAVVSHGCMAQATATGPARPGLSDPRVPSVHGWSEATSAAVVASSPARALSDPAVTTPTFR